MREDRRALPVGRRLDRRASLTRAMLGWTLIGVLGVPCLEARADDETAGEALLAIGKYEEAATRARQEIARSDPALGWRLVLLRALAATGARHEAARTAEALLERVPGSFRALVAAHDAIRDAGGRMRALELRERLRVDLASQGGALASAAERVAAGRAALLVGDQPKSVLAAYFEEALKKDPRCKAAYLAAGQLALDKNDDALAADWYRRGLRRIGPDADLQAGLARAFYRGDRKEMTRALDAALHLNPRHKDALLLRAEHEMDAEDLDAARKSLDRVLAVDPAEPSAWAFRAVVAHLTEDDAGAAQARDRALAVWTDNPGVDALIGRKLSEKYRFAEGATHQRRALRLDPAHLPAKLQLAQDLLRLGQEAEGWRLVEETHQQDGYDVVAYNLATLRGHLAKLTGVKRGPFLVRMDPKEASVYGDAVLGLLGEARGKLGDRYGFAGGKTVTVELYPDQTDFAVRTFGAPGGAGYLGVCFGNLITMNSPAGTGAAQVSWRSVLWHEYAHVVTLGMTRHRIPRWLSEGISVWEERQRDPTWGQRLNPRFKQMILGGELLPVGQLSKGFLEARTPEHLMFAYYQSSLVVEFLVARYGFPALKAILQDLGAGVTINRALAARTEALDRLEASFAAFARQRAQEYAPAADFGDKGKNSVPALAAEARRHADARDWQKARSALERSLALHPEQTGDESAYLRLAEVHRAVGDTAAERAALERLAALTADAVPAYTRILELADAAGDAPALVVNGERLLGVNPMLAAGWRALGRGHEARAEADRAAADQAVAAYRALLKLEPADPADVSFRLARLYRGRDARLAKRHVLDALAEAPRFREAQKLLLELVGARPGGDR